MNIIAELIKIAVITTFKTKTKTLLLAALTTSLTGIPISSHAGGGDYCSSNFSLDNRIYNECKINFPTLDTGNDTQANLYLLLADKGLIYFDTTDSKNPYNNHIHAYPLSLDALKSSAVNVAKNPKQSFLAQSETSDHAEYCNSFYTGIEALNNALEIDPSLTAKEKQQLLQFRQAIRSECADSFNHEALVVNDVSFPLKWSIHAQPYADYILANQLFYLGKPSDFYSAQTIYRSLSLLKTNNNPGLSWLIDTSNYMLIRTGINRIFRLGSEDYNYNPDRVDPKIIATTQKAIDNYLNRFKDGHHAASARGLQRRLYWLTGQQDQLIDEIEWQINHPKSKLFNLNSRLLPEEIERRVFFLNYDKTLDINKLQDPILITSFALYRLRPEDSYFSIKPLKLNDIEQLKPKFKDRMDLYRYLTATYYMVQQNNPRRALYYLPTDSPKGKMSYVEFSQYALKARALQELGREDKANQLWNQLHHLPKLPFQDRLTDLAIALQADQTNDYSELFGNKATIKSQTLKMRIIKYSADPELLQQIANRYPATNSLGAEARYALLSKSLMHGRYADYLKYKHYLPKNYQQYLGYDSEDETLWYMPRFSDFNWQGETISSNINCQDLTTTVIHLKQDPLDRLQNICLAEFIRDSDMVYHLNDYDKDYHVSTEAYSNYRYPYLGDIPSRFNGRKLNRLDMYKSIFATNKKDELSAYALHRALGCFASSGNNHCSDEEVDISVRKAWFKRLKSNFKNTSWAQNQKYYW